MATHLRDVDCADGADGGAYAAAAAASPARGGGGGGCSPGAEHALFFPRAGAGERAAPWHELAAFPAPVHISPVAWQGAAPGIVLTPFLRNSEVFVAPAGLALNFRVASQGV